MGIDECEGYEEMGSLTKRPGRDIFRPLGQAISLFSLIGQNDKVLLGISGGKDSLVLAWLLSDIRKRAPVKFSLGAVTINPGPPYAFSPEDIRNIRQYLEDLDIPYTVVDTGIAGIVRAYPTKKTACSLCANLRRGTLYKTARELGYRKVALAHHLDDAIETLFLNMFYQGNLRCFRPKTFLTRRAVEVIRPLVYIEEERITQTARLLSLPVVETKCTIAGTTERQSMKNLVTDLAREIPSFRNQMRRVLEQLWLKDAQKEEIRQPERSLDTPL